MTRRATLELRILKLRALADSTTFAHERVAARAKADQLTKQLEVLRPDKKPPRSLFEPGAGWSSKPLKD